mmetsp:Transcript_38966/g.120431  ORF Transcript_38966/g.120431 Transcript_38966/m.120431 type:complete len:214 (+) Transcript_38966:283-924(+)
MHRASTSVTRNASRSATAVLTQYAPTLAPLTHCRCFAFVSRSRTVKATNCAGMKVNGMRTKSADTICMMAVTVFFSYLLSGRGWLTAVSRVSVACGRTSSWPRPEGPTTKRAASRMAAVASAAAAWGALCIAVTLCKRDTTWADHAVDVTCRLAIANQRGVVWFSKSRFSTSLTAAMGSVVGVVGIGGIADNVYGGVKFAAAVSKAGDAPAPT